MIISVDKLKEFISTDVSDSVLEARLSALETSIRKKTNNNFQDRRFRTVADIVNGVIRCDEVILFQIGDTVMVGEDLRVITDIHGRIIEVDEPVLDGECVLVTKVVYPKDIIIGVVDIMTWLQQNPSSKAGISSETLSRHSVTYSGSSEYDADIGCPSRLLSFLNKYKKARF